MTTITGPAIVLRGNDIDTDRIMPARFLKAITFEGIEAHLFEDDRRAAAGDGRAHPLDDARAQGARVLIVNANFGCGSSREHAPQAILRRGIHVIVGESFAEIFFANAQAIGLPCVSAGHEDIERLMALVERAPKRVLEVDLERQQVTVDGEVAVPVHLPASARDAFLSGTWDAVSLLRSAETEIRRTEERLPY